MIYCLALPSDDRSRRKCLYQYLLSPSLQEKKYEANIKAGKDFLEANGKKDGVITLASGLQYEVINEGNGAKPGLTSTVTTHYHGTLIDGTVFDSSVQRGTPASFPVNGVIAGWTEALQLMPLGSKWRLFVPSNLAYGAQGAGQQIGPHTTLIFEVELLDIK
jgi:FKBP-type peptidyl-prolyl cis-trans isomerase FklB